MTQKSKASSKLCMSTETKVFVRDKDLCEELIGKVTLTQMAFFDILGRLPDEKETFMLDAVMVALMEHGLMPSMIAGRLIYSSGPEALQGAVAAGILGAGSRVLGTVEETARILHEIVEDSSGPAAAAAVIAAHHRENRLSIPGFGHPHHRPDDPRTLKLFSLAHEVGLAGRYVEACQLLSKAVDEVYGKHLTLNATAAVGAILLEIGIPVEIMRGFAIIARSAGLVAHIREEQLNPVTWPIVQATEAAVPYEGEATG